MSSFKAIENVKERNNTLVNHSTVVAHQIEKKHYETVGNANSNGAPLTTTATTSSAKILVTSNSIGKSVVSSLSMSLERKDSIQYMPRKISPHSVPAGQSTVIHLDNYSRFMAQRVTTTKTAFKRAEISEYHSSNTVPCSTLREGNSSVGVGILDVDLKVVLGGVGSAYRRNNKSLNKNKQKMPDSEPVTPSKIKGSITSLSLKEYRKPKELKINLKKGIVDTPTTIKPVIKKAAQPRRKRILKPKQSKKTKIKTDSSAEQDSIPNEESDKEKLEKVQISSFIPLKQDNTILRPCVYTLKSQKCINEMNCPYLHSNFPCKYYYLNIPCPQNFKCQFMHNGPLEPTLKDALRNHILDLLSTTPSLVETYFVQQIHFIDDISHRLQSLQVLPQQPSTEIIEVMDDTDEDAGLVIDENSENVDDVRPDIGTANTNIESKISHEPVELQNQCTIDKSNLIYENFKQTNNAVDEIDKKHAASNISPKEKSYQRQIMYDLLKEQAKHVQICENATSTITQLANDYDNQRNFDSALPPSFPTSNTITEQTNVGLANPNVVTNKENSESTGNIRNLSEQEENSVTLVGCEAINTNLSFVEGTEFLANEEQNFVNLIDDEQTVSEYAIVNSDVSEAINTPYKEQEEQILMNTNIQTNLNSSVPLEDDIEFIEEIPTAVDVQNKNEMLIYIKDADINYVLNSVHKNNNGKGNLTNDKDALDNMDLSENSIRTERNDGGDIETSSNNEKDKNFDKNNSETSESDKFFIYDKNEAIELPNNTIQHNETLELEITNDEKHVIENGIKETNQTEIEEQSLSYEKMSPFKTKRNSRSRLRSRKLQDSQEIQKIVSETTTQEPTKPIRPRRLRLPKPIKKTPEKLINNECQINANVVNILPEQISNPTPVLSQDDEISLTQNVILTKRFLKKAKAKLSRESELNESNDGIKLLVDQNSIETNSCNTTDSTDENNSSHSLHDTLIVEGDLQRTENINNDIPSLCESYNNLQKTKYSTKRRISFKKSLTAPDPMPSDDIRDKYNLDDNVAKKRRSLTEESDLDSSLKESKCLKLNNSTSLRTIKIDCNGSDQSKQENIIESERDFETVSAEQHQHAYHHQQKPEHEEQKENESVVRQQIENVTNEPDLHLQMQQQEEQQQEMEVEKNSATSFITESGNNSPHKQYVPQEDVVEVVSTEKDNEKDLLQQQKLFEENELEEGEISNTCNSYDDIEKDKEDRRSQSPVSTHIYDPEKPTSSSNDISETEEEKDAKYSTYTSLFNKLTNHGKKREINFENSSVNITPISSPTYGNENTIASPSPVRTLIDFRLGGEIDGRLTYPPIPYILYEIDLPKIEVNKPPYIDKLKKTIQLDPRIFRTHVKKQSVTMYKHQIETNFNGFKVSHDTSSSSAAFLQQTTSSMISPYDPRSRSSDTMINMATPSLPQQTALTPYHTLQTAVVPSSTSAAVSFMPNSSLPLGLSYHETLQPITQPQPEQSPNMFIYGCLQRSPWYQSLMSTMKIQINQAISQLVRALNNFQRERAFNPGVVFDVFKIDCAGELLEIMNNLGIFVDANGIINEQRQVPSFAGRPCCSNTAPLNAAYNIIQQYLTPNTHCTAASSTCGAASIGGNPHAPFVSCYVKAPEQPKNHSGNCCCSTAHHHGHNDDNNASNKNCNNRNDNNGSDNNNDRCENNNSNNNSYGGKRFGGNSFRKPYDNNNDTDNSNSYQQRSNQRSNNNNNNYNNNPRFMKPGSWSPSKSNTSSGGFDGGNGGGSYGGRGGRGGGRGGFNNNRRFNNNYNKDKNSNTDWGSSGGANDNGFKNNSPPRSSSPNSSSFPSGSPRAASPPKPVAPPAPKSDEENWD